MEGRQTQTAPPTGPAAPSPKSRKMMYAAIAVVIIVVVAAVAAVALMGNGGGGNGGNGTGLASAWVPQQGQHLDYSVSVQESGISLSGTMRMLVKSVDANTVTINVTTTIGGYTNYTEVTTNKANASFAFFNTTEIPSGVPITEGNVSVSTPWGLQTCEHLQLTDSGMTMDVYVYQNVMVKMSMEMSSSVGNATITVTLTGTNITG